MANDSRFALWIGQVSFGESVTLKVTHPAYGLTTYAFRFECSLKGESETRTWMLSSSELKLESSSATEDVYTWTPSASIAAIVPNSTSASGTIYLHVDAYLNGTLTTADSAINSYAVTVYVPDSMKPTLDLTLTPKNDNAQLAAWNIFAKGMSCAEYSIKAVGQYGATIKDYRFSFGGQTMEAPSGTTGVLLGSGAATATVTDSRGMSATEMPTVTLYDYSPPTLRTTVSYRCDDDRTINEKGSCLRVECSAVCSLLGGRNTVAVRARYRIVGGEYGAYETLVDGEDTQIASGLDADTVYEVELSAIDLVGSVTAVSFTGDNGRVVMHMRDGGDGVAFGKECTAEGFACAYDATFDGNVEVKGLTVNGSSIADLIYPIGSIYLSTASVDPAILFGGTWVRIKDAFLLSAGDTYSLGNTGGQATVALTASQMPKHSHYVSGTTGYTGIPHEHYVPNIRTGYSTDVGMEVVESFGNGDGSRDVWTSGVTGTNHVHSFSATSDEKGGNAAHDNMPPYLVVNVWKRTA